MGISALRPLVSRVLAAWLPALVAWLASHGIDWITPEMVETMVELGIGFTIFSMGHKFIDGKLGVNPNDAASATMAQVGVEQRKSVEVTDGSPR